MRQAKTNRGFKAPLAFLAVLLIAPDGHASSLARQCRQACGDAIAACVASGGRRPTCKRQTLRQCRTEGLAVCQGTGAQPRRADSCRGHRCAATTTTSTTIRVTTTTLAPSTTTTSTTAPTTTTTTPNAS